MIVLDASVIIAHLDADDAHHDRATELLIDAVDNELLVSPQTLAECYVGPARSGTLDRAKAQISRLEIQSVDIAGPDAERLAVVRAETGLRMPDCCVLLAAQSANATLATFDARLARAAVSLGLAVRPDLSDTPGS